MTSKTTDIYTHLLLKVLLALGALLTAQVAFLLCNLHIFHLSGTAEWAGLLLGNMRFGLATVTTFLLPYIILTLLPLPVRNRRWYRIVCEILYIIAVLVIVIPRGANSAYYQYTYRLLSDEIFSYLGISGQMGALVPHFAVDYWYAWACPLAITIAFLFLNSRIHSYKAPDKTKADWRLLLSVLLTVLLVRGGVGRMLQPTDAANYVQPKNTALVSNDAYNILRTLFIPDLEAKNSLDDNTFSALHTTAAPMPDNMVPTDSTTQRNVVILILESIGQEFMGCYNTQPDADTRTPFLDSLAQHSTLYDGRSNGKKSIEGIMAISAGIPTLMSHPFASSSFGINDTYTGIAGTLRRHGYHTAFYHGSYNGVMGFDSTCRRLGFDDYHGKDEYDAWAPGNNDYDGVWGIYDEPFLQYTVAHFADRGEPFFAEVFTVTSHHPFPIPEHLKNRFVEGRHPILKCVEYTDYALQHFFDQARRQPWFDNTIFIICGDHSGHGLTREYNDYDGWYRIPMMIYDPSNPVGTRSNRIVQQTDIYPTLLDYLGLDDTIVCFGQSALRNNTRGWQVYYANGYHVLVSNSLSNPAQHNIAVIMGDYESGTPEDLRFLKAVISQYNNRIINNKLTPEP